MAQSDILKVISEHPGIEQREVSNVLGVPRSEIGEQIRALARKKEITKEFAKTSRGTTWKLYPVQRDC